MPLWKLSRKISQKANQVSLSRLESRLRRKYYEITYHSVGIPDFVEDSMVGLVKSFGIYSHVSR